MEIQFQKQVIRYLRTLLHQQQKQEQTQQIRLSDAMPDIGHVLGCWGQILIRGKEWRSGSVGISGGVMAWVLYQPEGEQTPCCVDTWIPFQMKWDMEETERDGMMEVSTTLCHIDARMLSDRKLMVRANIGAQMHAMVEADAAIYLPSQPEDTLQMLERTYPMVLPSEAGEKQFDIEQQLDAPSEGIHKMVRFRALPTLTEYKIVADKLVLRGNAEIYALYMDDQGKLHRHTWNVPFSQYTQLDGEYAADAEAELCFALTQLELEPTETGALLLKLGFAAQYVIYSMENVTVVEDLYSPTHMAKADKELLKLPAVLHRKTQTLQATVPSPEGRLLDAELYLEMPQTVRNEDTAETELEGYFQILHEDPEGNLVGTIERWQKPMSDLVARDADYQIAVQPTESFGMDGAMALDIQWNEKTVAAEPISMIVGGEMGEAITPDPNRPSIILLRAGKESLWEIARNTGSTPDAIRKANNLQEEPREDQMLLIPIS